MWLIVGLGNPSTIHAKQRHNIGFMAADTIAERRAFSAFRNKHKGLISQKTVSGETLVLQKPLTYMNHSGEAVSAAVRFYKIPLSQVIVFYDDLDLSPAKVRVKSAGGAGGHNGIRSIDKHLGPTYWRVRMGIGRPIHKIQVQSYVLGDFTALEDQWRLPLLEAVSDFLPDLLSGIKEKSDPSLFMTRISNRIRTL